jgi:hypothetical protein
MNILAVVLILGATASAQRRMEVDDSIRGILFKVGAGAFSDARLKEGGLFNGIDAVQLPTDFALLIDGTPRSGVRGWAEAFWRIGGFLTDLRTDGDIGYSYSLIYGRYHISTETKVFNDDVTKTFNVWWTESIEKPRFLKRRGDEYWEVPIYVTIKVHANSNQETTILVGTATGRADTSDFRCRLIRNRRAEPEATVTLDEGLRRALRIIQEKGTEFYLLGATDLGPILAEIGRGMKVIRVLRVRR